MEKEQRRKLLKLIETHAHLSQQTLADMLGLPLEEVATTIKRLEQQNIIAGYHTMVNWDAADDEHVSAMIEVNVNLTRETSYQEIAEVLYQFPEVESLYLMSGAYDFMLLTRRSSMTDISKFVSRLGTVEEVVSTTTHIVMNRYKDHGTIYDDPNNDMERLVVSQ